MKMEGWGGGGEGEGRGRAALDRPQKVQMALSASMQLVDLLNVMLDLCCEKLCSDIEDLYLSCNQRPICSFTCNDQGTLPNKLYPIHYNLILFW